MADRVINLAFDADNNQIIAQVTDATGTVITDWGAIKLTVGKAPGSLAPNPGHSMGKEILLRETEGCDPATGDPRYCVMLRSEWYDEPLTSNPDH